MTPPRKPPPLPAPPASAPLRARPTNWVHFGFRIPPEVMAHVDAIAERESVSKSLVFRRALYQGLGINVRDA